MAIWAQAQEKTAQHLHRHRHPPPLPPWLIHLGALGVFGLSVVDSSIIPLPLPGSTDLLLLFLAAHGGDPYLLAGCAIAGSIIGGYTTWHLGKKGGEAALQRFVSRRILGRVSKWVKSHSLLAVWVPAMLPPPVPLQPFLLSAGALGVPRRRFLIVFASARTVRYSIVAWLGVKYGHGVVHLWQKYVAAWSTPVLWTLGVITVVGVAYGYWRFRHMKPLSPAEEASDAAYPGTVEELPATGS